MGGGPKSLSMKIPKFISIAFLGGVTTSTCRFVCLSVVCLMSVPSFSNVRQNYNCVSVPTPINAWRWKVPHLLRSGRFFPSLSLSTVSVLSEGPFPSPPPYLPISSLIPGVFLAPFPSFSLSFSTFSFFY